MRERILQALQSLHPAHVEVHDESHMHSRGQQTHYKAVIVAGQFAGLGPVRRHQAVYAALSELMPQFHALALHTYTPDEWEHQGAAPASPTCRGGSKHDQQH
ncbi:BolA/IbaG family iron-sulfur metabolism protein [Xanthomonadaceae bacterium JHOS43]|nr:BolA/IbaG family iron-sulfur metabolism protein [Xanthomonadaceae bacterium JHOS43]MCX7562217.1 BolA/IbaG family iron-sulfur metabolism protein [Xanthomonadaceae bacterium XH05]